MIWSYNYIGSVKTRRALNAASALLARAKSSSFFCLKSVFSFCKIDSISRRRFREFWAHFTLAILRTALRNCLISSTQAALSGTLSRATSALVSVDSNSVKLRVMTWPSKHYGWKVLDEVGLIKLKARKYDISHQPRKDLGAEHGAAVDTRPGVDRVPTPVPRLTNWCPCPRNAVVDLCSGPERPKPVARSSKDDETRGGLCFNKRGCLNLGHGLRRKHTA